MRIVEVRWQNGPADHPNEHARYLIGHDNVDEVRAKFPMYPAPGEEGGWLVIPQNVITLDQALLDVVRRHVNGNPRLAANYKDDRPKDPSTLP